MPAPVTPAPMTSRSGSWPAARFDQSAERRAALSAVGVMVAPGYREGDGRVSGKSCVTYVSKVSHVGSIVDRMTNPRAAHPLPVPPMHPFLWGTPAEARPLGDGTRGLLAGVLGIEPRPAERPSLDDVELTEPALSDGDAAAIAAIVGDDAVSADRDQRLGRARGKSYPDLLDWRSGDVISAPDACVAPGAEDELLAVLELCSERGIAVVPFGGGTSVVGGVTPDRGDFGAVISLDLARFNGLEDLDRVSGEATFGAGLTGPEAEKLLGEQGWSLGHFPQSFPYATIGGYA